MTDYQTKIITPGVIKMPQRHGPIEFLFRIPKLELI